MGAHRFTFSIRSELFVKGEIRVKAPGYDMRPLSLDAARALCEKHHGYGSAGNAAVYCFGVYETGELVAAYAWQPPPPGAARSVCPEAPQGVLALSRMVAEPRAERALNHVSKPLRRQMRHEIDRGRWPVLVTYSDEGQGHTGHVYRCSGWTKTRREKRPIFKHPETGVRCSSYSNGRHGGRVLIRDGSTYIQRWEHWACERGAADGWMAAHGWVRVPVQGKVWRSGNQAYTYVQASPSRSSTKSNP